MKLKIIIGACLSLASLASFAESNISDYVEIGYTAQDSDDFVGDYKGVELAGSFQLTDDFFISGKYIATEEERDLELIRKSAGIGYIFSANENSAWYTQLDIVNVEFDRDYAASFNDTGYQLSIGYQIEVIEGWTVNTALSYLNAGEVDPTYGDYSLTLLTVGTGYQFSEHFGVYADYEYESDGDRLALGLRYNF